MRAIFQEKRKRAKSAKKMFKRAKKGKIFGNMGKNVQNLKYFEKGQVIARDNPAGLASFK